MTTIERQRIRRALISMGFRKNGLAPDRPELYDHKGDGVYQEDWTHWRENTTILLRWDKKTK